MRRTTTAIAAGVLLAGVAAAAGMDGALPKIGLHAYTKAHAANPEPPALWGGPLVVQGTQSKGAVQWALPGPRALDPVVFGTPAHPVGWEPAPFPLIGVPPALRGERDGHYTITKRPTPFSDWRGIATGTLSMRLVDATAIDGAKTGDEVTFEAEFDAPDGSHHYRVVARKPLPHGFGYLCNLPTLFTEGSLLTGGW